MKKLELLKTGIGIIVSVGIGTIVGNAVKATTPSATKGLGKFIVALGSFALTGIASDMATKYTEGIFDDSVETAKKIIEEAQNNIEIEQ